MGLVQFLFPLGLIILFISLSLKVAPKEEQHEPHQAGQIGLLAAVALFGVDYFTSFFYATGEMMHALHPYGLEHMAYWAVAIVALANMVFGFLYMFSLGPFDEGGGSYTASMRYLWPSLSLIVAVTLIVDYVLTIVVSALSGADQFLSILNAYNSSWYWHFLIGAILAFITWFLTIRGRGESARTVFTLLGLFIFMTITLGVGLFLAYSSPVFLGVEKELAHGVHVSLWEAFSHIIMASMKGMVALTGLEAMSNGIQFVKNEDFALVQWGKQNWPKLKGLWEFYSGKSGIGRMVQTSFIFYGGITTLFLSFFSIYFNVYDGTNGRTLVGNLAHIGFTQIPGGDLLFWVYQFLAVGLLAAASMTAFQDAQATEWRDVAIGAIPEAIVKRDKKGTFTRSVTFTFIIAVLIMLAVRGKTTIAIPFYGIGVFLPITVMGFAILRHVLTHYTGKTRFFGALGAGFAGFLGIIVFVGQVVSKWHEGGWVALLSFIILFLVVHIVIILPGGMRNATQIHRIVRDKARVQGAMASIVEWQSLKMQEYRYSVVKNLSTLMEAFHIKVPAHFKEEIAPPAVSDYDHSLHPDNPEAESFLDEHIDSEVAKDAKETHREVLQSYTKRHERNSVLVPIGDLDNGSLQALQYARSLSHDVTAIHVSRDTVSTKAIRRKWDLLAHGTRLVVLDPDFDNYAAPLISYIEGLMDDLQPTQTVSIVVPQVVETSLLGKLRARTAMLLRVAFASNPNIVVLDLPYYANKKKA